jgi:hypothetical protein
MTATLAVTSSLVLIIIVICDFLMSYLKEQGLWVKYRVKLKKTVLGTHEMLKTAW